MDRAVCRVFAAELLGRKRERLRKSFLICLVVFYGLYTADIRVEIRPFFLYLTLWIFTAGVMWQTLAAGDQKELLRHILMLPFPRKRLIVSYGFVLGVYAIGMKAALPAAVLFAVARPGFLPAAGGMLCMLHAVLTAVCVYTRRKYRLTDWLLKSADPYSLAFGKRTGTRRRRRWKIRRGGSLVLRYFFRYLFSHKNYLVNTAGMCAFACLFPCLTGSLEIQMLLPLGFGILSLNTPLCILLSCDPALERAVRFLPGQRREFCVPYCLFLAGVQLALEGIFLLVWELGRGGVTGFWMFAALVFALQSALISVMLEWYFPVRNWRTESDLWHHPRKYVTPCIMLLFAGAAGTCPWLVWVMGGLVLAECLLSYYGLDKRFFSRYNVARLI